MTDLDYMTAIQTARRDGNVHFAAALEKLFKQTLPAPKYQPAAASMEEKEPVAYYDRSERTGD